jgi:hypothetical protein
MFGEINAIRALATKYSKPQLANLVQTGQLEPQKAVLAGMMIDRIAKSAMQAPQTTVAQDVLGAAPTSGQMPPGQMQQGQPPQMPPQNAGVSALPSGINDMAGGGIVAFADGGDVPGYAEGTLTNSRYDPAMRINPAVQVKRDQTRYEILAEELKDAQRRMMMGDPRAKADFEALQREMRSVKPSPRADSGISALIPSAQAEERIPAGPASLRAQAAKAGQQDTSSPLGRGIANLFSGPEGARERYDAQQKSLAQQREKAAQLMELGGGGFKQQTPEEQARYEQILKEKNSLMSLPAIAKSPEKPVAAKPEFKVEELPPISAPVKEEPVRIESTGGDKSTLGEIKAEQLPQRPELNFAQAYKEQKDAYKEAGVDTDIYSKMMADVSKKKEGMADRKERALGAALMSFGFEFASARKGQVFDKLNSAAQRSLGQYMNSMDKIAENEDRMDALNREIRMAENNFKRTGADSALAQVRDREIRRDNIAAKNAELRQDAAKQTEVLKVNIFGEELRSSTSLNIAEKNTSARLAAAMASQQNKGKLTAKQLFDIKQQLTQQLEPKLREQLKDFGSKEQIENEVQKRLDEAIQKEINKLASNPNVGSPEPDKYSQFTLEGA